MPQIGAAITADRPGGTHLSSRDGLTEMIVVPIEGSPSSADFRAAVHDLQSLAVGDGVEVAVTGPAGIASDAVEVFGNSNRVLLGTCDWSSVCSPSTAHRRWCSWRC